MRRPQQRLLLVLAAGSALVSACAVGPNFQRPTPPSVQAYTPAPLPATAPGVQAQRFSRGAAVDGRWWTLFGSPALDALEDEALKANPDLAAAKAALRQARETYLSQRASLWPTIDLGFNGQRTKNSQTIAPVLADNSEYYTLYQGQLTLAYTFDIFGGERRQIESVEAQAEAQRFQTAAAYLTLTTNVASAALQMAGLEAQLAATDRVVAADRETLALTRRQQSLGEASAADVAAAQAALEQAEVLAPPLRKQIDQQRDLLADLVGRPGAEAPTDSFDLTGLRLPPDLPASLPADLARQRPDILAAEANLHAASAQVGVAIAARLPSITLAASAGGASGQVGTLLSGGNSLWSVSGDLAQTVFDAGALKHKQRAAEAALEQAKDQYRSVVLAALQNVADVLQTIVEDGETERHAAAAQAAAERSLTLAQDQLRLGEAGALPALTAQGAYAQAEVAFAQARAARLGDTVALYQALGGGWQANTGNGAVGP